MTHQVSTFLKEKSLFICHFYYIIYREYFLAKSEGLGRGNGDMGFCGKGRNFQAISVGNLGRQIFFSGPDMSSFF
jgi:hypothetical protein